MGRWGEAELTYWVEMKGEVVELDRHGRPVQLLGHGHHFTDLPGGTCRRPAVVTEDDSTPMDLMVEKVTASGLRRPPRRN